MTHTHLSHFGMKLHNRTDKHVFLLGSKARCKQMAHAHGYEIADEIMHTQIGGRLVGYYLRHAECTQESAMIRKWQARPEQWCLMMPVSRWDSEV